MLEIKIGTNAKTNLTGNLEQNWIKPFGILTVMKLK
jgi:hypothetical protein